MLSAVLRWGNGGCDYLLCWMCGDDKSLIITMRYMFRFLLFVYYKGVHFRKEECLVMER